MTCKDLGGACDAEITGNTPEEMSENCKNHAMLMVHQGDQPHMAAMQKMGHMSPDDFNAFWTDFEKRFVEAEDM